MNWDEIAVFLAAARTGQLGAAGRQMGVDRTTAGRRLSALEARLGVPLFVRSRDGLRLTAAGMRARVHAEAMERGAQALTAELTPEAHIGGTVRIAVTEAMAPFLVEVGLMGLCDAHPDLQIELLAGNQRLDLAAGEADLALRIDPIRGDDLRARCVNRSPVVLYASRAYVARHGAPKSVAQLAGHRVVLAAGELQHMPEAKWLAGQPGVTRAFSSNSLPALVAAAREGLGIVALAASWGDRVDPLVRLFEVPELPPRAMWMVYTAESARRPACALVMARLVELLGG